MAKDYVKIASEVLKLIGGEENITHLERCSTRLRFSVADMEKVQKDALKNTAGVMGLIMSGNQCQVVIGTDVEEAYAELIKLGTFNREADSSTKEKKNLTATALDFMVGVFQPLVPAIAGAGILKAMLSLLVAMGMMSNTDHVYKVMYFGADAALYFLPLMVAVTLSNKLNCNRLVAISAVGALILPSMTKAIGEGLTFFNMPIQNIAYPYQIFPAILSVTLLYFVEKYTTKYCPKPIRIFFVPMVCFIVVVPAALLVLGPLGYNLGKLLTVAILALYETLGWLAIAVLAAILPFMIAVGMHKALIPYALNALSMTGKEIFYMPASLAHNISEGGACLGVALRTKDKALRATAVSAGISAIFGITEPALYGVTLQHKRAMYGVMAGSFVGGAFAGFFALKAFVLMGPGLAGMAMFVDPEDSMNIVWGFAGFAVSLAVSFVTAYILYRDIPNE